MAFVWAFRGVGLVKQRGKVHRQQVKTQENGEMLMNAEYKQHVWKSRRVKHVSGVQLLEAF